MIELTPELLRPLLRYEPETGELFWRPRTPDHFVNTTRPEAYCKTWNARYAGSLALTANSNGYRCGNLASSMVYAHRAAWVLGHEAKIPSDRMIDHVNGVKHDNRLTNLRLATLSQNLGNMKPRRDNMPKGVSVGRWGVGWSAKIYKDGKTTYLGQFSSIEEATEAYREAATRLFGAYAYHNRRQE